jgi:hypothetical protein
MYPVLVTITLLSELAFKTEKRVVSVYAVRPDSVTSVYAVLRVRLVLSVITDTVNTLFLILILSPTTNSVVKEVPVPTTAVEAFVTETVPVRATEELP